MGNESRAYPNLTRDVIRVGAVEGLSSRSLAGGHNDERPASRELRSAPSKNRLDPFDHRDSSGEISWSASVDVALCFGWIDGIRKSIDDQSYKIRFTSRKQNSVWSAVNVQKVNVLIDAGKMKPAGLHLFHSRSDKEGYTSQSRNMLLDPAFEAQLMANETAWAFFSCLAPSYKRVSIWWVMSAKRDDTRQRRFGILIASSHDGLKIPMLRKYTNIE